MGDPITNLIRVGTQELRHRYMGWCPDYTQPDARDPLCAACKAIKAAEALLQPPTPTVGPRCPDCQIAPDLGPDVECEYCREVADAREYEDAIYADAFQRGWQQGVEYGAAHEHGSIH